MTCLGVQNAVNFNRMKHLSPAYIGGTVIVAIMALAVFVGGANAHHNSETAEQTSTEVPQKADEKTEVEA